MNNFPPLVCKARLILFFTARFIDRGLHNDKAIGQEIKNNTLHFNDKLSIKYEDAMP